MPSRGKWSSADVFATFLGNTVRPASRHDLLAAKTDTVTPHCTYSLQLRGFSEECNLAKAVSGLHLPAGKAQNCLIGSPVHAAHDPGARQIGSPFLAADRGCRSPTCWTPALSSLHIPKSGIRHAVLPWWPCITATICACGLCVPLLGMPHRLLSAAAITSLGRACHQAQWQTC